MLQYKKDLRDLYASEGAVPEPPTGSPTADQLKTYETQKAAYEAERERNRVARQLALPRIYRSNLPLSLTDKYDTRAKRTPIRAGDPLNIIVNRVYVRDNGQRAWLLENSADVAVVVTVDDGRSPEPKHVIVAYERDVGTSVKLPDDDLIAYSTEAYNNEPVRIEVTVLALYGTRNKTYTQILGVAAGIGAAVQPAYAPAISAASQVGKALINAKQDRILSKFTFELYPWKTGPIRGTDSLGVPRVAYGHYLLVNANQANDIGDPDGIHLSFGLVPYRVATSKIPKSDLERTLETKVPAWPVDPQFDGDQGPFDVTHLILTVDNTKLTNAQQIIARADAANRILAQLAADAIPGSAGIQLVDAQLDDLKSKIRLQVGQSEFSRQKGNPAALERLFKLYSDPMLLPSDQATVLQTLRESLPSEVTPSGAIDIAVLQKWYDANKGKLIYDQREGRYQLQKP